MASSGGDGTIEIPVIATDAATATLAKITSQLDALTRGQQANTAATQNAVTTGTLWASVYTKAADLVLKGITSVTAAFEKSLSSTIAYGDSINALSKRTGIATDDIQALKFAGEQAGIGFDAISSAAKRLEVSLAKGGTKTLKAGFAELKLSAADAAGPGGMETIIDKLAAITDESKRTEVATQLFNRQGPQIARVAVELSNAAKEARQYGLVIDSSIIQAGAQTNDILDKMGQQLEANALKFGGAILKSGALQAALKVMSDVLLDLTKFLDKNSATITAWVNTAIILAADAIAKYLVPTVLGLIDTMQFLGIGIDAAVSAFNLLVIGLQATAAAAIALSSGRPGEALEALKKGAADAETELTTFAAKVDETVASNSALHDSAAKVQVALDGYANRIAEGGDANVKAAAAVKATTAAFDDNGAAAKKLEENLKKLSDAVEAEGDALEAAKVAEHEAAIKALATSFDAAFEAAQKLAIGVDFAGEELSKLGDARINELLDGLTNSLKSSDEETVKLAADIRDKLLAAMSDFGKEARGAKEALTPFDKAVQAAAKNIIGIQTAVDKVAVAEKLKKMGFSAKEIEAALGTAKDETDKFAKALDVAANTMQVLGISADSTLGVLIGGLAAASASANQLGGAVTDMFKNGLSLDNVQGAISGIAGIVGAFKKATDSASGLKRAVGGALLGAKVGSQLGGQIGSLFGPGGAIAGKIIGGISGAVIGGVAGLLRKPGWVKAGEAAGKALGVKVSQALAKEIEATAKKLKIDFKSASLLSIGKAIEESGKDARTFGKPIEDLIAGIANKSIPAAEGMEALAGAFDQVTAAATKAGVVGDKTTRAIIAQAKAAGTLTDGMKEFQRVNVQLAASGVAKAFPNISAVTEEQGKAQGVIFGASFFAAVGEFGLVEGADMFRESFTALSDDLSAKFGPEFVQTVLGPVKELLDLTAEGSAFRTAAEGAAGLKDALTGIANAGFLTQESFNAFGIEAKNAFDQAVSAGATQKQGLEAILPLLQAQVSAAEQYGFTLDANTQALVDQAKTEGFTFPTDPLLKVVDLLGAIATKLGAELPESFNKMGASAEQAASRTATAVATTTQAATASIVSTAAAASTSMGAVTAQGVTSAEALASAASSSAKAVEMSFSEAFGMVATASEMATDEAVASMTSIATEGEAAANSLDLSKALEEIMAVKAAALDAQNAVGGIGGPQGGGGGSQSDRETPRFAEGGFIPPRPGGTRVIVGEKGEGEFVVPASQMGQQPISVTYQVEVNANGLDKAGAVAAIQEALKNADRGLLLQLQKANTGRR